MARHQTGEPVRITTASAGRDADIAMRQRRYLVAMSIRTVCFVAAIFVTPIWLRVVFVAGALLLPYVAVVMANAGSTKSDGFALMDGPSGARELPPGDGSA
jgi:hypothetical protein